MIQPNGHVSAERSRLRRSNAIPLLIVATLVATAGVAVGFRVRGEERFPVADEALTELYTLRATHGDLTTGAYSRFGWNHPGPAFFYLAVPLYVLSGHRYAALQLTALLINVVSLLGIAAIIRRATSRLVAFGILSSLTVYVVRFGSLWTSPWNPHVPLIPLALLMVAAAALAAGRTATLPIVVGVSTFVVQSHIAFALPVAAIIGAAALFFLVSRRRRIIESRARWTPISSVTIALIIALWFPVLVDHVTGDRNLARLIDFFSAATAPTHSIAETSTLFAHEATAAFQSSYNDTETWIHTVARETKAIRWWQGVTAFVVILLVAGAFVSFVRKRFFDAACSMVVIAGAIGAVLAMTRIAGPIEHYLVLYCGVIGAVGAGLTIGILLTAFERLRSTSTANPAPALFAIVAGSVFAVGIGRIALDRPVTTESAIIADLSRAIVNYCDTERVTPTLVVEQHSWPIASGIVLQVYKSGRRIAVNEEWVPLIGRRFAAAGGERTLLIGGEYLAGSVTARGETPALVTSSHGIDLYVAEPRGR